MSFVRSASRCGASSLAIFSDSADSLDCSSSAFARYVRSARSASAFCAAFICAASCFCSVARYALRSRCACIATPLCCWRAVAFTEPAICAALGPPAPAPRSAAAMAADSCCWYCFCFWSMQLFRAVRRVVELFLQIALALGHVRIGRGDLRRGRREIERLDAAIVARELVVERMLLDELVHDDVPNGAFFRNAPGAAASPHANIRRARERPARYTASAKAPRPEAKARRVPPQAERRHFSLSVTSLVMSTPPKTMLPLSTTRIRPFAFATSPIALRVASTTGLSVLFCWSSSVLR